jgi:hypothetical protein
MFGAPGSPLAGIAGRTPFAATAAGAATAQAIMTRYAIIDDDIEVFFMGCESRFGLTFQSAARSGGCGDWLGSVFIAVENH